MVSIAVHAHGSVFETPYSGWLVGWVNHSDNDSYGVHLTVYNVVPYVQADCVHQTNQQLSDLRSRLSVIGRWIGHTPTHPEDDHVQHMDYIPEGVHCYDLAAVQVVLQCSSQAGVFAPVAVDILVRTFASSTLTGKEKESQNWPKTVRVQDKDTGRINQTDCGMSIPGNAYTRERVRAKGRNDGCQRLGSESDIETSTVKGVDDHVDANGMDYARSGCSSEAGTGVSRNPTYDTYTTDAIYTSVRTNNPTVAEARSPMYVKPGSYGKAGVTIVLYPEPVPGALLVTSPTSLRLQDTLECIYRHSFLAPTAPVQDTCTPRGRGTRHTDVPGASTDSSGDGTQASNNRTQSSKNRTHACNNRAQSSKNRTDASNNRTQVYAHTHAHVYEQVLEQLAVSGKSGARQCSPVGKWVPYMDMNSVDADSLYTHTPQACGGPRHTVPQTDSLRQDEHCRERPNSSPNLNASETGDCENRVQSHLRKRTGTNVRREASDTNTGHRRTDQCQGNECGLSVRNRELHRSIAPNTPLRCVGGVRGGRTRTGASTHRCMEVCTCGDDMHTDVSREARGQSALRVAQEGLDRTAPLDNNSLDRDTQPGTDSSTQSEVAGSALHGRNRAAPHGTDRVTGAVADRAPHHSGTRGKHDSTAHTTTNNREQHPTSDAQTKPISLNRVSTTTDYPPTPTPTPTHWSEGRHAGLVRVWSAAALGIHTAVMSFRRIGRYTPYERVPRPDQVFLTVKFLCERGRRLLVWPLVYARAYAHTESGSTALGQKRAQAHTQVRTNAATRSYSPERELEHAWAHTPHTHDPTHRCGDSFMPHYSSIHTHQQQIECRSLTLALWDEIVSSAVDTVLGLVVGVVLWRYSRPLVEVLVYMIREYTIEYVIHTIRWLAGSPGGVKLNPPVAQFLGMVFEVYTGWWGAVLTSVEPHLHLIIRTGIALLAPWGLVVLLCGFVDLVFVLTFHVYLLGRFATNLYGGIIRCLISTSRLFRGYKRNVLRLRIDSCHLAYDQLLVNTMFFTTLFFTVPTVTIYYAFFLSCKALGVAVHVGAYVVCMFLWHFPLYSIYTLYHTPDFIPGGLVLAPVFAEKGPESDHPPEIRDTRRGFLPRSPLATTTYTSEHAETLTCPSPTKHHHTPTRTQKIGEYTHVCVRDTTVLAVRNRRVSMGVLFARAHNAIVGVLAPYQMGEICTQVLFGYSDPKESGAGAGAGAAESVTSDDAAQWQQVSDYEAYEKALRGVACVC
ncbi:hypothetical protein SARC_12506 [Sphaeroforma arctica JP610]|uniref:Uncharacterized protein n=1 Tax=Sphaeroforma arctica JP610 TaxID=667725 RepID=A0A0L0FFY1_9EUKA|nr:hypothetical protein SARC_12506 [Sphaeroforma arctica JP610]KNC74958.1 hypothetical protein SARC_12506 [Sphaeroforma arctica JP610]|eukprot:XP_014148860.1 hypothetical protein SARC_12506 [Sphaeroforma arctica JP610]